MSLRLLIAAVASVAVIGTASAQYPGSGYSYTNLYTGFSTASNYQYNPFNGTLGGYSASYNPWTGYGTRNYSYNNVYGGYSRGYSNYNSYSGAYYGTRSGYNPWNNSGFNSYRANPGYGYYGR